MVALSFSKPLGAKISIYYSAELFLIKKFLSDSNRSKKKYLRIFKRNISAKSADFTCSGSGEVENVSANQRPRQLSGISNHFKKIFFRTPIATINVVSWA
jgi:hypothetical protein